MSKTFKYVKDFEFPSEHGYTQSSKGYAKGGKAHCACGGKYADGGKTSSKNAVHDERETLTKISAKRRTPAGEISQAKSASQLSKVELKRPPIAPLGAGAQNIRPLAPQVPQKGSFRREPLIPIAPMKKGGSFGPKGEAKMGKVMGEFKAGELHSGSKKGPEVKSREQAIAIAMSEARKASKKK